jgi:hypothetical protein
MSGAKGIAAGPNGDVAVLLKKTVVNLDARGWIKGIFGGEGKGPGKLSAPVAVAVGANGDVAVLDEDQQNVQVFSARGGLLRSIGKPGKSDREIKDPIDMATDPGRRWLAVLEKRDRWNVKVFDFDGNLKAALPGVDGYLSDAGHLVLTETGKVHVSLDDGNVAAFDVSAALNARSAIVDADGANQFAKDRWKMKDLDEPSGLAFSNLALFFAVAPKDFVQVLDLTRGAAFFAQIKDPKNCPKPLYVTVDDFDRVYVWDADSGRIVQFER